MNTEAKVTNKMLPSESSHALYKIVHSEQNGFIPYKNGLIVPLLICITAVLD